MCKQLLLAAASIAALAIPTLAIPTLANADTICHHEQSTNRAVGTVVGAGLGALIGGAVAGHHDTGLGVALGAIGGGVAGNVIGGASVSCDRYDNGYYDRSGQWHDAHGYYEHGRWVATTPGAGYYDNDGRWIAETPQPVFYSQSGPPIIAPPEPAYAAPPPGYYGAAPQPRGYYDSRGRWVAAPPQQPGYYGTAPQQQGYYDAQGRWVSPRQQGYNRAPAAGDYGAPVAADSGPDFDTRLDRVQQRIQNGQASGRLSGDVAERALHDLDDIRRRESSYINYHGGLSGDDLTELNSRLDGVVARVRSQSGD